MASNWRPGRKPRLPKPLKPPYSRTRTSGGFTALTCRVQSDNPGSYPDGDVTYGTGALKGWTKVMTDVVTPGYSALRKKLNWINNPVWVLQQTVPDPYGIHISHSTPWSPEVGVTGPTVSTLTGDAIGLCIGPLVRPAVNIEADFDASYPDVVSVALARQKAIVDCLNRIAPPSSQSLVTLAEFPKSVQLIAERARKLAAFIDAVKRRDVAKLKQLAGVPSPKYAKYPKTIVLWDEHQGTSTPNRKSGKTPRKWSHTPLTPRNLDRMSEQAQLWLEYRYGWSPLVNDIVDQMKACDAVMRRKDRLLATGAPMTADGRAVFKAKAKSKISGTVSSNLSRASLGRGTMAYRRDVQHNVECHAYAHYCHSVSGFLSRFNDFGAFAVPRAIWELCPWSFVIDWFIPIGDWLGALEPKVGVDILASGVVVHDVKVVTRVLTGWTPAASGPGAWPNSPVTLGSSDTASRTRWTRLPGLPLPVYPMAEVKLNLKRLVDAAALLKRLR